MNIKEGDKVPAFSVNNQDGHTITEKDLLGKKSVLYFYPKDNTPGCTTQSCNLRDNYTTLLDQGYQVFGISADSEASHQKFIAKFELPFPLLADIDRKMIEAFGVWQEKNNFGKKYMGIVRTTFVIDEDGKISEIIKKVNTKDHTNQIIK